MRRFQFEAPMALAALLLGANVTTASAAAILSPVAASASSTFDGTIGHTIDHSGLLTPFTSGVTDFDAYIAGNPSHSSPGAGNAWEGSVAALPINLDFDLGGLFSIESAALWTSFAGFSINAFTVLTSTQSTFAVATNVGSFNAVDTPAMNAQVFSLVASVGQFVRIQVNSDRGAGFVNLSEIAFEASNSAVPEPASFILLGSGLVAALGLRRGRSRSKV
jgi:hypothetical protein